MSPCKNETGSEKALVIGLGQACVDYLGSIPIFPREDEKIEMEDLCVRFGGPASTALVALSRLGVSTSFLGSISDDTFGLEIMDRLRHEGVDVSALKITPGYTSQFAFICVTRGTGKRTIIWHRGSVPHLKPEDVEIGCFPNARFLHVDSLMTEAATEAAKQAKQMGMGVVMDAGTMRKGARELISLVDVLIASETFSSSLVKNGAHSEESLYALREMGPQEVVITLGAEGSIGLNDRGVTRQKAFPVKAIDTTGAGDVYHGAYIYGLLEGWDMPKCMRFGSAAAALKCKKRGAQVGAPDLETVHNLMGI